MGGAEKDFSLLSLSVSSLGCFLAFRAAICIVLFCILSPCFFQHCYPVSCCISPVGVCTKWMREGSGNERKGSEAKQESCWVGFSLDSCTWPLRLCGMGMGHGKLYVREGGDEEARAMSCRMEGCCR